MIWPWPDLDLTWGEILKLTFQDKKVNFRTGSTRRTRWCQFYFRIFDIKKVINEIPSQWKMAIFHLMTSGAKTIDLRSNLIEKRYRVMIRASKCFFLILPSYDTFGDNSDCLRKNRCFLKVLNLVTSGDLAILTWPENNLSKSLRSRRGLSYAVYRLSLRCLVFEFGGGGGGTPPPPPHAVAGTE